MPKSCCVFSCTNNVKNHPELSFYLLPSNKERRRLWLQAISRASLLSPTKPWSPKSKYVYVCSRHFISGEWSVYSFRRVCSD